MIIAVDFDGTIVEHKFPAIGKDMPFAFETLRALQRNGHLLILWTYRAGKELDDAVTYCKKKGIEFYAINKSYPEEIFEDGKMSRKVNADLFIDDRNIGGFYGWGEIWQELDLGGDQAMMKKKMEQAQVGTFQRLINTLFK